VKWRRPESSVCATCSKPALRSGASGSHPLPGRRRTGGSVYAHRGRPCSNHAGAPRSRFWLRSWAHARSRSLGDERRRDRSSPSVRSPSVRSAETLLDHLPGWRAPRRRVEEGRGLAQTSPPGTPRRWGYFAGHVGATSPKRSPAWGGPGCAAGTGRSGTRCDTPGHRRQHPKRNGAKSSTCFVMRGG